MAIYTDLEEREYRALSLLSQSSMKAFAKNPRVFHKQYILKERVSDDEDGQFKEAMLFGSICDSILTREQDFDMKFYIADATAATGQMGQFVESLYKHTLAHTHNGELAVKMEYLYQLAYDTVGFKRDTLEKVKERFATEGLEMYKSLRNRNDRLLITQKDYEQAHYLVEKLKVHPFCCGLINMSTDERFTVLDQLVITGEINGVEMKAMLDRTVIDEKKKVIYIFDYKIGSNAEMFRYNYLKLGYYAQLGTYTLLMRQNYPDYTVLPLRFLAIDRTLFYDPLRYKTKEEHVNNSLNGFTYKGRKYKGINEMLDDYKYALANDYWLGSKEAHANNGEVELELYND